MDVKFCCNCGQRVPFYQVTCPHCGMPTEPQATGEDTPPVFMCPNCKYPLRAGARFCKRCGVGLNAAGEVDAGAAPPPPVSEVAAPVPSQPVRKGRSVMATVLILLSLFFSVFHVFTIVEAVNEMSGNRFASIAINAISTHILLSVAGAGLGIAALLTGGKGVALASAICCIGASVTVSGGSLDMLVAGGLMLAAYIVRIFAERKPQEVVAFSAANTQGQRRGNKIAVVIIAVCVIAILAAMPSGRSDSQTDTPDEAQSDEAEDGAADKPSPAVNVLTGEEQEDIPDPIVYTGSGNETIDLNIPEDFGLFVFHITGNASGEYFSVLGLNSDGDTVAGLINTEYVYDGITVDWSQLTATLQIEATGDWTVSVESMHSLPTADTGETVSGTGDTAYLFIGANPDGTVDMTWDGERDDFMVGAYVLVTDGNIVYRSWASETSGAYEGANTTRGHPLLVVVRADSSWTITIN